MRYYFLAFLIYEFLFGAYFYNVYTKNKKEYYNKTIELAKNSFNSAINGYEMIYDNAYLVQSDRLSRLLYLSNGASTKERDGLRQKLLKEFMNFFHYQKLNSLNGFHLVDKYGKSLLRFHKPLDYDDDIIKKRYSIGLISTEFRYKRGFEAGIFQESYHFEYPLFYDGNFVGSCEYNVDSQALIKEMGKFYGDYHQFLLNSKQIQKITLKDRIKHNYFKLKIGSQYFYLRKNSAKKVNGDRFRFIQHLEEFQKALINAVPTVVDCKYHSTYCSVVVLPIKDIKGEKFAFLLVYLDKSPIANLKNTFFIEMIFITLFGLMLYLYIFKEIQNRKYAKELINLQSDLILVSDGKNIEDTNSAFLNFFGYETLSLFKEENSCVCNRFIKEDGYLQDEITELNWISYIQKNKEQNHKVKMLNTKNEERIFSVEIERIRNSHKFFILFRDITEELYKKKELEERANFDALTQIFNRSRFEFFLKKELEKAERYGTIFSLVMFDIDHFKLINDTYGHDVGDIVLKELTGLVSVHTRDVDIFARWGGEEFMIISQTDIYQSEMFAEKLRQVIEENVFTKVGSVKCSFGISQYRKGDTMDTIVKRCDNMLYSAKESGRNCVASLK